MAVVQWSKEIVKVVGHVLRHGFKSMQWRIFHICLVLAVLVPIDVLVRLSQAMTQLVWVVHAIPAI